MNFMIVSDTNNYQLCVVGIAASMIIGKKQDLVAGLKALTDPPVGTQIGDMAQHQKNEWGPHGEPIYTKALGNYEKVRPPLINMFTVLTLLVQLRLAAATTGFAGLQQALCPLLLSSHILYLRPIPDRKHCADRDCRWLGNFVLFRHCVPMSGPPHFVDDFRICST